MISGTRPKVFKNVSDPPRYQGTPRGVPYFAAAVAAAGDFQSNFDPPNSDKMHNGKSPGPDGIPIEFFKWLYLIDKENNESNEIANEIIEEIQKILNECWDRNIMPEELELVEVVTLYRKGNVQNPANYRPISLLNAMYNVFAGIIKSRIEEGVEEELQNTKWFS